MTDQIEFYITLLETYLKTKISGDEYRTRFFKKFKSETGRVDEELYEILEELFGDTEVFEPDEKMYQGLSRERPGWYLNETQFRKRAATSLGKLKEYATKHKSQSQ